jgi:trimeric autotransporter adhesin
MQQHVSLMSSSILKGPLTLLRQQPELLLELEERVFHCVASAAMYSDESLWQSSFECVAQRLYAEHCSEQHRQVGLRRKVTFCKVLVTGVSVYDSYSSTVYDASSAASCIPSFAQGKTIAEMLNGSLNHYYSSEEDDDGDEELTTVFSGRILGRVRPSTGAPGSSGAAATAVSDVKAVAVQDDAVPTAAAAAAAETAAAAAETVAAGSATAAIVDGNTAECSSAGSKTIRRLTAVQVAAWDTTIAALQSGDIITAMAAVTEATSTDTEVVPVDIADDTTDNAVPSNVDTAAAAVALAAGDSVSTEAAASDITDDDDADENIVAAVSVSGSMATAQAEAVRSGAVAASNIADDAVDAASINDDIAATVASEVNASSDADAAALSITDGSADDSEPSNDNTAVTVAQAANTSGFETAAASILADDAGIDAAPINEDTAATAASEACGSSDANAACDTADDDATTAVYPSDTTTEIVVLEAQSSATEAVVVSGGAAMKSTPGTSRSSTSSSSSSVATSSSSSSSSVASSNTVNAAPYYTVPRAQLPEQHARAAAQAAAAATATVVAASSRAAELEQRTDTHALAAAVTAAAAAAINLLQALTAQTAALQELHAEQRLQQLLQQQPISADNLDMCSDYDSDTIDEALDVSDDCPPLAHYSMLISAVSKHAAVSTLSTANAHESTSVGSLAAPVTANSSCGSNSLSRRSSDIAQKQSLQQQLFAQCGKLTKNRCSRCLAVYYCCKECQVQCFRNPEHRAQCDAAAAVLESTVV